jgi:phosphoadenylyl-sulfate reductase (thioredoxin)
MARSHPGLFRFAVSDSGIAMSVPIPAALVSRPELALWADAARQAESWSAEQMLRWAEATFAPRLRLATGFGAEGCVLVDLVARHELEIDLFTIDTGLLFPETYELWQDLESYYGVTIEGVRPAQSVAAQAAAHGDALWERDPSSCCELRKVAPLRAALSGRLAWISAIRRDQTSTRRAAQAVEWDARFGLVKINPLVRWTKRQVWDYIRAYGVPYNALHDRGYPSIGCAPCTGPVAPGESERAGRWRGRDKTECGLHVRVAPAAPLEVATT